MHTDDLIAKFSDTTKNRQKAIFSTLFIAGNRLQTLFDSHIPELSLKQFMLLSIIRQSREPLTFTQLGKILGCSRQNIRKLADILEKKGFASILPDPRDTRAARICPTEKADRYFQNRFLPYEAELSRLFAVYTEEEISQFFYLCAKLYAGIDNLEKETEDTP